MVEKQETGFRFGKNKVKVIEKIGSIPHNGRRYDLYRVIADGKEYISQRLYNAQGKFIKQFMLEPEVAPRMGSLLGNSELEAALNEVEEKAWKSLARYKFQMFGYWAAIWVHLNKLLPKKRKNPWYNLVELAREKSVTI